MDLANPDENDFKMKVNDRYCTRLSNGDIKCDGENDEGAIFRFFKV